MSEKEHDPFYIVLSVMAHLYRQENDVAEVLLKMALERIQSCKESAKNE